MKKLKDVVEFLNENHLFSLFVVMTLNHLTQETYVKFY